ncbi:hypothetical protein BDZ91DRAFT_662012, partial [Kalaharituber pfeilii]
MLAAAEEFSNGFLSDLAPLIALFGEQVTKQFMSQTLYWSDHIIFSMAPLGIITAVVSAIRVAGPNWMKAVIGRARESRGLAEVELMSSTSHDVCELWNGRQIVRVLGSAPVRQLLFFPDKRDDEDFGLYTLEEAAQQGLLDTEDGRSVDFTSAVPHVNMCAPNISLNFSDPVDKWHLRAAAVFAVLLQLGVLAFQAVTRYYVPAGLMKSGTLVGSSAFILAATGTATLGFGMMLCSYVVEQSTEEFVWQSPSDAEFFLVWVQKGQVVNDQVFKSFLIAADGKRRLLMTSHPCDTNVLSRLDWTIVVGTISAIVGFTLQFVGLRGLHWSAMVLHIVATFVMTIIRTTVRCNLASKPFAYPLP